MVSFNKAKGALLGLGLAAAAAFSPIAARAQTAGTAPTSVGGVASVTDSTVYGNVNGTFVGGSVVTASGVGVANTLNNYGGYASVTATTGTAPITSGGIASVTNSAVSGNVNATGLLGSTVDQSGVGYANTIQNVGQVSQISATTGGKVTAGLGVAVVDSSKITGDVTGTSGTNSLAIDSTVGKGGTVNNFGGYASITMTAGATPAATAGSAYVQNGSNLGSAVSAAAVDNSVVVSGGVGASNAVRSVGTVGKVTFTGLNP